MATCSYLHKAHAPNLVVGGFSEVHRQNRTQGPDTPTESAASNTQGPDLCPLYIAHRQKDALGPIRGTPQDADRGQG
jgi:hypothetical protein